MQHPLRFKCGRLGGVSPLVAGVVGAALAYGVGSWLVFLHGFEQGNGGARGAFVGHALRVSTIALPVVLFEVWVALSLARRLVLPLDRRRRDAFLALAGPAALAGAAASAVFAAGFSLQAFLAPATAPAAPPLPLHFARELLLGLPVAVALALAACAVVCDASFRPRTTPRMLARRRAGVLAVGLVLLALAGVAGSATGASGAASAAPCAAGAPLKHFDVQAIDVDITLNRFGDHDPAGKMYVLSSKVGDVRKEETAPLPNRVSTGLRNDPIQPLVIRANEGDCVEISFTNNATGGRFGIHADGLVFNADSSGDAVGRNTRSDVAQGGSATYRFAIPDSPTAEGAHYLHPGPGARGAVNHGLFGVLSVEPHGSTYLNDSDGTALESGWEAVIHVPSTSCDNPAGKCDFREFVQIYHEVGDESEDVLDATGHDLPRVDPFTEAYRPGTRAMNYRSEPFMDRLKANPDEDALGYGSYTFGDPATPMMRGYLKDPTKIRLVHGGSEMFHVFHLHGGGDRWRFNPLADPTNHYWQTGLTKTAVRESQSTRLDSQAFGPGETYNLEIEGGAGAVQQDAADFLYHCHIASHYIAGMWSFWRVFDTAQPDLAPLPDRGTPARAVDSAGLIGSTFNGFTITKDNLDDWIRPQLPPQGVPNALEDASVWDWTIDRSNPSAPIYLGEPEDKRPWPDLPNLSATHPGSLITDITPGFGGFVGDRPKLMFDPANGRIAWPLLRPHVGHRPPFSPNGHSGAPWLGEGAKGAANDPQQPPRVIPVPPSGVDPFANRNDQLCPNNTDGTNSGSASPATPVRHFNVVAVTVPIQNTKLQTDPDGLLYVLAKNKQGVYDGTKPREPLAIRSNIRDCDAVTLTSEIPDAKAFNGFSKVNMHIHHVQFDPQASDGVITGLSYEQSVRPYPAQDPSLVDAATAGTSVLRLSSVAKFLHKCADGSACNNVFIGVGLGTDGIEVHRIASVDTAASTVTLSTPLARDHPAGDFAGVEFVQYRWYPDVQLDNIFWHDHVDGIHGWGHGLVGQLVIEPEGSTYHDPKTGATVDSGTIVDIHTTRSLVTGVVDGSYREMVLWEIDDNPSTDATLNLKAEPWSDRLLENPDPSLLFSSYTHGDPITPLPRAYPGDPFVIRTIQVGPTVDGLHVDGHRFVLENRYPNDGRQVAKMVDTIKYGISERFTLVLDQGAGGRERTPGDYLYMNSIARHFRQGAWGILRVLPGFTPDLQPLPGNPAPPAASLPTQTGGRPPAADGPGSPCPATAAVRTFAVSAVDLPSNPENVRAAFVPSGIAAAAEAGTVQVEPLVLHMAAGECLEVQFTNRRAARASFHVGKLLRTPESSGVNVGFNPENTVAPGATRTYRLFADSTRIGSALVTDLGARSRPDGVEVDPAIDGMYGAVDVAPPGATFTDPVTGNPKNVGAAVDVQVPGQPAFRDFTLFAADSDPRIGQSHMPYPRFVDGPALINYRTAGVRPDNADAFASTNGDPATPILRAYAGDPMVVHVFAAPGSEQVHSFTLGGESFAQDTAIPNSEEFETLGVTPWASFDANIAGGAGGRGGTVGDLVYGDLRRPFTQAGMWGLQRILPPTGSGCPIRPLAGRTCTP